MKPKQFHDAVSRMLEARLRPMVASGCVLNRATCLEIYAVIFDGLVETIKAAQAPITNEAVNYLAQQYYDGVVVNGGEELDPHIFTQRARLENIETRELALLALLLQGTDFALPVLAEIKKRS